MAPKFGTSGLRGLVVELTPDLVADYIRAFLAACPVGSGLFVARDLRDSSPAIADVVIETARAEGISVTDCGPVPTPALALAAMGAGAAAVMVTGSHIPADRNGLKFYVPQGEITKADEAAILAALGRTPRKGDAASLTGNKTAGAEWVARYLTGFGAAALTGLRVGVWSHSAVSRDMLSQAMRALGAEAVEVGRSDVFIPIDTEAVPQDTRKAIRHWVIGHGLDALVSTDGDGDRPLLADETGTVVPGDILGQITARQVGADTVVTPVTSNGGAELSGHFNRVVRTKVGSPFVIAGMEQAQGRVAGYEANGGFVLGFDARCPGPLPRLMTRDSLLPLVAVLVAGRAQGGVSRLIAQEPLRVTLSDRIENIDTQRSQDMIAALQERADLREAFLHGLGLIAAGVDLRDGLRMNSTGGEVVHLRPSGNAPELRIYVESASHESAGHLMNSARASLCAMLGLSG